MKKSLISIFVIALLIGGGLWLLNQFQKTGTPVVTPGVSITPQPSAVSADWLTYVAPAQAFQVQYPPSVTKYDTEAGVSLSYFGPTQATETELYDGFALHIEHRPFPFGIQSLEAYAQHTLDETLEHSQLVAPIRPITINQFQGFTYTVEGLGVFTTILVAHPSPSSALVFSYLAPDPNNAGYAQTVDQIIHSVKVPSI